MTADTLTSTDFWRLPQSQRLDAFARLRRRETPAYFAESTRRGFFALVRHADVTAASRNHEVFISGPGVTTPQPARWVRLVFGDSMVNLDDPRHAKLRSIVSK